MADSDYPSTDFAKMFGRRQFLLLAGSMGVVASSAVGIQPAAASGPSRHIEFGGYGACDGITDDSVAFATALSELSTHGGGTLVLPPKTIAITMDGFPTFEIPANISILGSEGATRILLSSSNDATYVSFASSAGDNVVFDGIELVRSANCRMAFFHPGGYSGFHIRNCLINGQRSRFPSPAHGVLLNREGAKKNLTIVRSTITEVAYGLLQSNEITADVETIVVSDCEFHNNYGDDLEFNAPNSNMTEVTVTNCIFTNNLGRNITAGLGIGMAHVVNAQVLNCYFENYYSDAIHLEDYCENILISENTIVNCATNPNKASVSDRERGGITVNHGCSNVVISGNHLDHTANENSLHGIVIKALSGITTAGGRPSVAPRAITVTNNTILCGKNYQGMWIVMVDGLIVRGNNVVGSGDGLSDGGNAGFGIAISGGDSVIDSNQITGFRYGLSGPFAAVHNDFMNPPWSTRRALGNPGVVSQNILQHCYVGILADQPGALRISNNTMLSCVRPMVVGQWDPPIESAQISGNLALNCVYPTETEGSLILTRAPGFREVPVGADQTIEVNDVLQSLPAGTVVKFSGGGVFKITTPVTSPQLYAFGTAYNLVGDVSGANIQPNEYGVAAKL